MSYDLIFLVRAVSECLPTDSQINNWVSNLGQGSFSVPLFHSFLGRIFSMIFFFLSIINISSRIFFFPHKFPHSNALRRQKNSNNSDSIIVIIMLISTSNQRKANLINNVTGKTVLIIAYNSEVLSTASSSDMDNFMYYLV